MDGTDGLVKRKVSEQRFHIAGSAGSSVTPSALQYAHTLVERLTSALISEGGRVVVQLGEEPLVEGTKLSKIFDWTMLEQVARIGSLGKLPPESIQGTPCIGVGFSDWKRRIPPSRIGLVQESIDSGLLEIAQLPQPLHIGGVLRERQAFYGDILVTLGGGPGVEHLAQLYRLMREPVIPLDLSLKIGKVGASERLNVEAMENPSDFFEYEPKRRAAAALSNLSLSGYPDVEKFVARFSDFVANLSAPYVFFAHLLNRRLPSYRRVSDYFDQVVNPVTANAGFSRFDPGKDASEEPFLNVEIFDMIHSSSLVVVDLTELRPNCLLELGFALGRGKKVIVTAVEGTKLPFDAGAFPCHFWRTRVQNDVRKEALREFVAKNINRRKID